VRRWPNESHKNSARALETRGLARVRRKNKVWNAEITDDGCYYLERGRYPEPPEAELHIADRQASDRQTAKQATLATARRAIRRATTSPDPGTPCPGCCPLPGRPASGTSVFAEGHPNALQDRCQPRADR
jgi:hypothetical protein